MVSLAHFDRIEDAANSACKTGAHALEGYEVGQWILSQGMPRKQIQSLNFGGNARFDFGSVQMVPAIHSSSLPDGSSGGVARGFVVRTREASFHHSADTALTLDMQLIPRRGKLRFALLCLGDAFTTGPEYALEAAGLIDGDEIVGVHFETWPLWRSITRLPGPFSKKLAKNCIFPALEIFFPSRDTRPLKTSLQKVRLFVALVGMFFLAGCVGVLPGLTRLSFARKQKRTARGVHPQKPELVSRLGIIESTDPQNRFALLDIGTAPAPPAGSHLLAFSGTDSQPTAELVVGNHQKRPYLIADILSGTPRRGDSVALVPENRPTAEPRETPRTDPPVLYYDSLSFPAAPPGP